MKQKRLHIIIYLLFLVGFFNDITPIIGIILAYYLGKDANKQDASHFTYQKRTFWLGLLYGIIAIVIAGIIVLFIALGAGNNPTSTFQDLRGHHWEGGMGWGRGWGQEWGRGWGSHRGWGYMMNSPPSWWNWRYLYAAIPIAALIAWWITRCIRGLVLVNRSSKVPNPKIWWV